MNSNEINGIKDWLRLLYDELPNVVKPLFFLSVYIIIFLLVGKNLELNNSLWLITKEKIFNLAFYLGIYTLVFRALNKAPQELRKLIFARRYPRNKLNNDYFLGQYENRNEVYVFELRNEKRKLWITNIETKRYLWGQISAIKIDSTKNTIPVGTKKINLNKYPREQKYDGQIDILTPENKDNLFLVIITLFVVIIVVIILNLSETWKFIQS